MTALRSYFHRRLGLIAITTTALAYQTQALAFCRTTTCAQQDPPPECVPGLMSGYCQLAGTPLYWPQACVSFSVQKDGSPALGITADLFEGFVSESFANWQNVACPEGGNPNIRLDKYPRVECAEARYNQSSPNQNVWLFRDDAWPHKGDGDRTIALTLVSFNPKSGEIYDVDVELNSFNRQFKVESQGAGDDLQSVIQHESGHFLGLAHSNDSQSTMWSNYNGSVDMRSLELDDAAGLCAAYPPVAEPDETCNADPRHGFSTQCLEQTRKKSWAECSQVAAGTPPMSSAFAWLWVGAVVVTLGRRKYRS
ncbi:MAG TPA: matrixin family metalloprotease [Polyangiaceae bacterium]